MARRGSTLAAILVLDALLLGAWVLSAAFVSAPAPRAGSLHNLAPAVLAALASAQMPLGAQAVEKWTYQEPKGELDSIQASVLLLFFFLHAAGVADFYAKKTGGNPAIPINPFRQEQFINTNFSNAQLNQRAPEIRKGQMGRGGYS